LSWRKMARSDSSRQEHPLRECSGMHLELARPQLADSPRRCCTPGMRSVAVAIAVVAAAALAIAPVQADAGRSPICTRGATTVERDPRGLLPLTDTNPIGSATDAALLYEKASARPQVRSALLAIADAERGPQAKLSCGTRVWQRTVVVYILDRAMLPAQSAAQRVFFVGRFRDGYHVWQIVH